MATTVVSSTAIDFTSDGSTSLAKITGSSNTLTCSGAGGSVTLAGVDILNIGSTLQVNGVDVATQNGIFWKESVICAASSNVDISTGLEEGDTVDGISLEEGDRILLRNQSTASQNGVYTVVANGAGAASRSTDLDSYAKIKASAVYVRQGTDAGSTFVNSNTEDAEGDGFTLGTTGITYALQNSGTVADGSVTTAKLADDAVTSAKLADGAIDTPAQIANDLIDSQHIAAGALDTEHYAAGSVDTAALADDAVTGAKLAAAVAGVNLRQDATSNALGVNLLRKDAVQCATDGPLTGVAYSGTGPGKTITKTGSYQVLSIDGYQVGDGDRVLVKGEADKEHNGIYTLTTVGNGSDTYWQLTRATDADNDDEVAVNMIVDVIGGTQLGTTTWYMSNSTFTTVDSATGTTGEQEFTQWSYGSTYTAGNGLSLGGTQFSVDAGDGITLSGNKVNVDNHLVKGPVAVVITSLPGSGYTYSQGAGTLTESGGTTAIGSIDGVTVAQGDRVLVVSAATTSDVHNGIYTVTNTDGSSAWVLTRAADADADGDLGIHAHTRVVEGTTYGGTVWTLTSMTGSDEDSISLGNGTDTQVWTQTSLGATGVDDSSIEITSGNLNVKASGVTNTMLAGSIATTKLADAPTAAGTISASDLVQVDANGVLDFAWTDNFSNVPNNAKIVGLSAIAGQTGQTTNSTFTNHNSGSDIRLKKNVDDVTMEEAERVVRASRPVKYLWRATDKPDAGFIAQEAEKVVPHMVHTDANGMLAIAYGKYAPYHTKLLQGLLDRVDQLEKQLTAGQKRKSSASGSSSSSSQPAGQPAEAEAGQEGGQAKRKRI